MGSLLTRVSVHVHVHMTTDDNNIHKQVKAQSSDVPMCRQRKKAW